MEGGSVRLSFFVKTRQRLPPGEPKRLQIAWKWQSQIELQFENVDSRFLLKCEKEETEERIEKPNCDKTMIYRNLIVTFDNKSAYLYKKKISSSFSVNKGSISTLVISKLNRQAYIENFLQFSNKTVMLSCVICKGFLSDNVLTAYLSGVGKRLFPPLSMNFIM